MPIAKKYLRSLLVGGVAYRWKVTEDREGQDWLISIHQADTAGQRLFVQFKPPKRWHQTGSQTWWAERLPAVITPRIIRQLIEVALERGWQPTRGDLPALQLVGEKTVPELPSA